MNRIIITGISGSGKTTLGKRIEEILSFELLDMDRAVWQENWEGDPAIAEKRLRDFIEKHPNWIITGDHGRYRRITWGHADTILWLDYPLLVNFERKARRVIKRVVSGQEIKGTRLTWRTLFSLQSPLTSPIRGHWRTKRKLSQVIAQQEHQHLTVIRHRSPRETEQFLKKLAETVTNRA